MAAPRISLEQWRAFTAVVDSGSYAKAAERLRKSQSSVTYGVQQIERLLGVSAFRIDGRRAVLTPTGELLYRRARFLLTEASALEQASQRLSAGWEAGIAVAAEIIFPTWLLLDCLAQLGSESPHTRVELMETVLGHRSDALTAGVADLAIYSSVPPGFLGDPLLSVRFVLVTSADHPLQHLGRKATLRDLRQHRHIVVRETGPLRDSPTSVEATQRWTVSHLSTSIAAVRHGYGFAWLPELRISEDLAAGALRPVPSREGGERFAPLYLIFADREHAGPATLRLAEILRERVDNECARTAGAARATARTGPRRGTTRRAAGKRATRSSR
jgi:DNA-binding transcriptional LysR family regulator